MFCAQGFFVHLQVSAAAHQHHDVAVGGAACLTFVVDRPIAGDGLQHVGELRGFFLACAFFGFVSRSRQRIAQNQRRILCCFFLAVLRNRQWQYHHIAGQVGVLGGVRFEIHETLRMVGEYGIHRSQHGRRIAAGVVVVQLVRGKMFFQVFARHAEQPRIGTAKAVDGLLGIADDEHGGLRLDRHRGIEPRAQDLPLQRIGVLELVQQHMAVTAVEFVLHGLGVFALLQQAAQLPFQIGEIHLLLLRLERLIAFQEGNTAMQHGFVQAIGLLFGERVAHFLQATKQRSRALPEMLQHPVSWSV